MAVIGIDLGGTKLAGALVGPDAKLLHKTVVPLGKRTGVEVGCLIRNQIQKFFETAQEENFEIEGVGVSVPGISYQETGKVWAPNIPGWENYPLREELSSLSPDAGLHVTIDSDRACYILGETWQGAAQGCKDAIFLAVGTGIGAGILTNGQILRGANDVAGAIGWLALNRPFVAQYRSCGCFENHASGEGIAKVAREFLAQEQDYVGLLRRKPLEELTAHDVFEAYEFDDPIAVKVLYQAIELWGMSTANLVSLFNPEKIIFGGGVFGPGLQFLSAIHAEARKWAQPISIEKVKLEGSLLGNDAGLYGAAYLALNALKEKERNLNV
jgi:glucokinase